MKEEAGVEGELRFGTLLLVPGVQTALLVPVLPRAGP